jgi:Transcriptional regulator
VDQDYFDSHFLLRRRYCFVVHRSHPLASYDTIDISQLQGENIMIMNESFKVYHILMSLCKKKGFKPKFTYEAGEIAPIQNLVIKKYGVGISTEFVAKKHQLPETKILFVNDPAFSWNIYLISKKQKTLSKEARTFIDYIQKSSPIA